MRKNYRSNTDPIQEELDSDEQLIWSQTPTPRLFDPSTLPIVLFAIPWTSFSIFWICGAAGFKIPDFSSPENFFPLFGLPFLFIGIGMLSSPYWHYRNMKNTHYAITNKRIITIDGIFSRKINSYMPSDINSIQRKQRSNNLGDVTFSKSSYRDSDGDRRTSRKAFYNIQDPKHVEELVRALAD